jgi:hypothetical protein
MTTLRHVLVAIAAVGLLAGCGGGGNGNAAPQADPLQAVPAEATQSAPAMVSYLATLSQLLADAREAIDLSAVGSLFTSDTSEPESVQ